MGEYVQCQECGSIHQIKRRVDAEGELYLQVKCPRCRGETTHLCCGDSKDDLYITYNLNLDTRYYHYGDTKQND